MTNEEDIITTLIDERNGRLKSFKIRFLIQLTWNFIILGSPAFFLYKETGVLSFYFTFPIIVIWLTWFLFKEKRFKQTTFYMTLDSTKDCLYIESIDKKSKIRPMTINLNTVEIRLDERRLGRLHVPGYELTILKDKKVVYRERDGFLISRLKLKEIGEKLIKIQVDNGRQKSEKTYLQD